MHICTVSERIVSCVAKHNNFKDLATYALIGLITPASNAIVETESEQME